MGEDEQLRGADRGTAQRTGNDAPRPDRSLTGPGRRRGDGVRGTREATRGGDVGPLDAGRGGPLLGGSPPCQRLTFHLFDENIFAIHVLVDIASVLIGKLTFQIRISLRQLGVSLHEVAKRNMAFDLC